jgi:uncharacterized surface protein with fasciclin (FAS1) repeats
MKARYLLALTALSLGTMACTDNPTSPDANVLAKKNPAPAEAPGAGQAEGTIVEIALAVNGATGEFSTLIFALQEAGLVAELNGKRQYTVFAPTDQAFVNLDMMLQADFGIGLGDVVANTELLTDILLYHVKEGRRFSNSVLNARQLNMANGEFVFVGEGSLEDAAGQTIGFEDDIDIPATNGVIHVIDTVLLPPSVLEALGL